jgi:transposase
MSNQQYPTEFRDEAVCQVLERGFTVKEVSKRLGVSTHSLHKWIQAALPGPAKQKGDELLEEKREILKLQTELRSAKEERIIKKGRSAPHKEGKLCVISNFSKVPKPRTKVNVFLTRKQVAITSFCLLAH